MSRLYFKKLIYTAELTFVLEGGSQGDELVSYAGLARLVLHVLSQKRQGEMQINQAILTQLV